MSPWWIAVPLAAVLILFFAVFAAAGAGLVIGSITYSIRSILRRENPMVLVFLFVMGMFGWVIMNGAYDAGSDIIESIITRLN